MALPVGKFSFYTYPIFPGGSDGKESVCNAENQGSIPGLGRTPGEGIATHSMGLQRVRHD